MIDIKTLKQLIRYGIIGLSLNFMGYLIYLMLTWNGLDPKLVVSIFYPVGAIAGFYANRQWTFSHDGKVTSAFFRFGIAHVLGYIINLSMLYIMVDGMGFAHQYIQLAAIFVVAGFLFIMMRFFVFPGRYSSGSDLDG